MTDAEKEPQLFRLGVPKEMFIYTKGEQPPTFLKIPVSNEYSPLKIKISYNTDVESVDGDWGNL